MDNKLDLIVTAFAELIRLFIISQYADSFLEKKRKSILPYVASYFITSVSYFVFHNLFINLVATFAGVLIIAINYHADIIKRVLFSTFILAISSIIDLIAVFLLTYNPKGNNYDIMSSFLSVGLFLISSFLVRTKNHYKDIPFYSGKRIIILLITILNISTIYIISIDSIVTRETVIYLGVVLFIINTAIIGLYDELLDKYVTEQENSILREQMKIYENQQRVNIDNEKRIRGIKHDMKHHCIEISNLARNGRNQEILDYIGNLVGYINETNIVQSGVDSIDGIMNYKIAEAVHRNIPIETHIIIPDDLIISSFDMNIILGNLMDNAIEASELIDNPNIRVEITYKINCLFIKIINKFNLVNKDEIESNTSKKDKKNHGYGLENVRKAVEKYHGNMRVNCEGDNYCAEIFLFLNCMSI